MGLRWTTQRTIRNLVKKRESFLLGNIRAEAYKKDQLPHFGRLSLNNINYLKSDISAQEVTYVVFSYQTPIGWTTDTNPTGWCIPAELYSNTTKTHQDTLIAAISEF